MIDISLNVGLEKHKIKKTMNGIKVLQMKFTIKNMQNGNNIYSMTD